MSILTGFSVKYQEAAKYKDALSRQVGEAIKIMMSRDELLNSKSEDLSHSQNNL